LLLGAVANREVVFVHTSHDYLQIAFKIVVQQSVAPCFPKSLLAALVFSELLFTMNAKMKVPPKLN